MKPVSLLAEAEKEVAEAATFYESCAGGLGRAFADEGVFLGKRGLEHLI